MKDKSTGEEDETLSSVGFGDDQVVMDDEKECVGWSELPKELWINEIVKHLNTTMDILRFRSVCKTWRSVLPHPSPHHTIFAPQVCVPLGDGKSCLLQTKIYCLEQLSPRSGSSSPSKGWLVKFGESKSRPSHPFHFPIKHPSAIFPSITRPRVLNLTNFHVVELIKAYTLNLRHPTIYGDEAEDDVFKAVPGVRKVVFVPNFSVEGGMVFALYNDGILRSSKIGEENWNIMNDENMCYDDIILHRGKLYVVNKRMTIFWLYAPLLELVTYSSILADNYGQKKHLVESGGKLHVVDMYIGWDLCHLEVFKEENYGRWSRVDNLGDVSFVLTKYANFSLSGQDYYNFKRNCIYFYAKLYFYDALRLHYFSLEDGLC